jgi:PAS domain S-box-containing protein
LTALVKGLFPMLDFFTRLLAMRSGHKSQREIAARKRADDALQRANVELERRVHERTAELAQANASLRYEREMLRITLASIGDAVIVTDVAGRVTFLNRVGESLTGWTHGEAAGRPLDEVFNIVNERTRKTTENPVKRVLAEGKVVGLANHTTLIAKVGTEFQIDDSAAPISDDDGHIVGVVLVFRDVSERRKAEIATRTLASIVASSDDAIIGKNMDGIITSWNQAAERLFGYSAAEAIGRPISVLAPLDRADEMPAILARLKQGERIEHFDTVRCAKNGRLVPISLSVSPIKNEDGEIVGASKIARDISDRKRAESALLEEKARLLATLNGIGDAVIVTDAESRVTLMNPVAQALSGWNDDAAGRPLEEVFRIVNEQTGRPVESPVGRVLREGAVVGLANHTALINRDGMRIAIEDSAAPIRGTDARIVGVVLVFRDARRQRADLDAMTRLHALSTRLLSAGNLATALDDVLANAMTTCGADFGNVQLYNRQAEALEIVAQRGFSQDFLDHFRLVRLDDGSACGQAMRTGERIMIEDVELDPAFEPHRGIAAVAGFRSVQSTPMKGPGGNVVGMLSVHFRQPHRPSERDQRLLDLHAGNAAEAIERIRYEDSLRDADRRKNEFLATLAHELRNPLAPLRNAVELLRVAQGNAALIGQASDIMGRQVDQMVHLVDDLLDVSRISQGKVQLRKEQIKLAGAIASALEAVRPLIDAQAQELSVALPAEAVWLDADATRLAQVIANLLNNAAKYTPKGGRIWLNVERRPAEVVVSIRDTGIGIAPEHLPNIFEIFSQVAPALERSQGGLGIGLSLVRGFVELHGGKVAARSEGLGRGSEFTVCLPVVEAPELSESRKHAGGGKTAGSGKRRILAVDDNRDAVDSLALMLKLMGHETRTVYDGLEAVQEAAAFLPEVVLLDIGLPKMNGFDTARHIREQPWGKDILLVAITGWGQDEDQRRALEAGFDYHLTKPVQAAALEKLLRDKA